MDETNLKLVGDLGDLDCLAWKHSSLLKVRCEQKKRTRKALQRNNETSQRAKGERRLVGKRK